MLQFVKMEGIGNDYIYMDGIHQRVPLDASFIQKISDRHFGIGSDGLIVILDSDVADFKMRIFNMDGSEAKMCGNGIRCFAKFVYDEQMTKKTVLKIETLSGIKTCTLHLENKEVTSVSVDMGEPETRCAKVPVKYPKDEMIAEEITVDGKDYRGTAVSMGNPHFVIETDDLNFDLAAIGPSFEKNPLFPEGVNTEFVKVLDDSHLDMRVWERGSGETKACGTGACAVAYACYLNHRTKAEADVKLLGGHLQIAYRDGHIFMTGPARTTFRGYIQEENYE